VVNDPRKNRPYALIVDAATGSAGSEGGIGAVLCQSHQGALHVIAYASRALSKHKKNYTPFLAKMTACCWSIEHFSIYLKGRTFTLYLYTNHKGLEKLFTVHTKTLNRLQQIMRDHDFIIQHNKGSEMPAAFLSRNVVSELNVSAINIFKKDLKTLQNKDPFIRSISEYIQFGKNPLDSHQSAYVCSVAPSCFIKNEIIWRRISCHNMPHRNFLLLPLSFRQNYT
jgi:hypothetical protein